MLARLERLPFVVILIAIGALAMLPVALQAYVVRELEVARAFFYGAILFLVLFGMMGLVTSGYTIRRRGQSYLLSLVATFALLPLMLAVPFHEAAPDTRFLDAYVEMVSSLTTTGATLFFADALPQSLHIWRALVGWLGGFLMWLTAIAILAPLNLGGFEVLSPLDSGRPAAGPIDKVADPARRLVRFAEGLLPIYAGLTVALWIGLVLAGEAPGIAICHAMSTLATSGISPLAPPQAAGSGIAGEVLIFVFLIFALSRQTFTWNESGRGLQSVTRDPELRLGLAIVAVASFLLFLRHWLGSVEAASPQTIWAGLRALWGGAFTVMSFLTTSGFESGYWDTARAWSRLETPGLVLMGVALIGGGVATTAGGVKLLRVFALYKHGVREMEKLVHPHSIGGAGSSARRLRRQGAFVAWIFFMLFAMSLALTMAAFALTGTSFEAALVFALAALSTTGPLVSVATTPGLDPAALDDAAKMVFAAAMILGRLETLALIALLNPDFWRA